MGSDNLFSLVAKNFDVFLGPLVALVYPLYASIQAIETRSRIDDQQWLTYWVLYSLITLFELTFVKVLEWFPIWSYAKLFVTCWLVLPYFNGAAYVYGHFIRPFYWNPQFHIRHFPCMKNFFRRPNDILAASEAYMAQHGTQDFRRLLSKKAERDARARSSYDYGYWDYAHSRHPREF